MTYQYSGEQAYPVWSITGAEAPEKVRRLRVLISGKGEGNDHFYQILAANVRSWGYNAIIVTGAMEQTLQPGQNIKGDILLYDMDVLLQHTDIMGQKGMEQVSLHGIDLAASRLNWPEARLNLVLSSGSVSRHTLERLDAIALLHKPFDMRTLERYLRIFQRLLYPEVEVDEASSLSQRALIERERLMEGEEGTREGVSQTVRILVADDQEEIAWGIRQCLIEQENQRYHYEVRVVYEGLALLEQCLIWQPHCVVTDLLMPWLNGYQVMRCLASNPIRSDPAFIVISALMKHEIPAGHSYLQEQRVRYVSKPFDSEELLSAIECELSWKIGNHHEVCGW